MQRYNCIIVYNQEKNRLLFCKRRKNPYKGLYNLVGGKIEEGEDGFTAAYRELKEETGIRKDDIQLHHLMDFTYYQNNCIVEVYTGVLNCEITLMEEDNPLIWLDEFENFFDLHRFAGEGNIGHMIEQVRVYGLGLSNPSMSNIYTVQLDKDSVCVGVDGCKGCCSKSGKSG